MKRSFPGLRNSNSFRFSFARLVQHVSKTGYLPARPFSSWKAPKRHIFPSPFLISSPSLAAIQCRFSSQAGEQKVQQQQQKRKEDIQHDAIRTMNGASSKRKASFPASAGERPQKQRFLAPNGGVDSPGLNTPDVERELDDHTDEDISAPSFFPVQQPDTAEWQATVENVIRNVVSIRFCQTAAFDTDAALTSEATGFVVDAEKG
jgi:hypothetical protein